MGLTRKSSIFRMWPILWRCLWRG